MTTKFFLILSICLWQNFEMVVGNDDSNVDVLRNAVNSLSTASNFSPNISDQDITSWAPPAEMIKRFPYYISGYDNDHRPVIVCEFGQWDVRSFVDKSEEDRLALYKYTIRFLALFKTAKSPVEDASDGITYILDAKGFTMSQLASLEVIKFHLWMAREIEKMDSLLAEVMLINMSFVAEVWLNIIRPVSAGWLGRAESVGTKPELLFTKLNQKIPKDQLPSWYGGTKTDFGSSDILG